MSTLTGHWYRGGTSKCWLFSHDQFSGDRTAISKKLLGAFGASDPRQLHGVGGGTSTTSKAAIVTPAGKDYPADITYLFAQVGIGADEVEYTSNCGNCASAVALYALEKGLVHPDGDITRIRMSNENTGAMISAYIDTPKGVVPTSGDVHTPGVQEPGIGVDVSFENIDGTSTNSVLPTGVACEFIDSGNHHAEITCIDAGAPSCLINAPSIGATGAEDLSTLRTNFLGELIKIRGLTAVRMGLSDSEEQSSPAVPKVGLVGSPLDYVTTTGEEINALDYDLSVRMVSMFDAHPAIGITSVVAIARSAVVEGSTVNKILKAQSLEPHTNGFSIRLGTLSGVVTSTVSTNPDDGSISVSVLRSAHHIADAQIYI